MILSAALMLDWLGEKHGLPEAGADALRLHQAVDAAFACGRLHACESGGKNGTQAIAAAVIEALARHPAPI
jgi:3-isopropylmalate dehydrogenase